MTIAIAHRGDPVNSRENTLPAMSKAMAAGADMVEIDLQRSADGVIVVIHDETLNRLWGVDGRVDGLEWSQLSGVGGSGSEGGGDVRIPSFSQVLEAVPVDLMVDFTGPEVVAGALDAARAAGALPRCLFVTGHVGALGQLRALAPDARIGLTWLPEELPPWTLLDSLRAETWNPFWQRVDGERVRAMHDRGYAVSCWTVDEPDAMGRMVDAGVDAIVSNRIADLRRVIDGRQLA